jgi:ABC-type multidrug transport system ATPase subunit
MISVRASNIGKCFGPLRALEDVSFEVNTGELFGIIGPDGAGKTTLVRILTSLLLPDEGQASVEGYDTVKDYKEIRKIIGYMPGRFSLYQDLSVEENLKFYATVFGTTIRENYDMIRDIYSQLEPFRKRLAGRLSGGMKQKLALSCALIHRPRVLFLDEPTTGVDAVSRKEFWDNLRQLQQKGITILVSTAYMDEATQCDRLAMVQQGKVLTLDTPDNVIAGYDRSLYAIGSDQIHQLLEDLRQYALVDEAFPFGDRIHFSTRETIGSTREVMEYFLRKGHKEVVVEKITPTLEDCFMNLMEKQ